MQTLIESLKKYSHALPLSYSKVKTLLRCPLQYQKRYIVKEKQQTPPESEPATVGKFSHKLLENLWVKGLSLGLDADCIDYPATWLQVQSQFKLNQLEYNLANNIYINAENIFLRMLDTVTQHRLNVYPELQFCMSKQGKVLSSVKWPSRFFFGYIDFTAISPNQTRAIQLDYKSHASTSPHTDTLQNDIYTYFLFHRFKTLKSIQNGYAFLTDDVIQLNPRIERDSEQYKELETKTFDFIEQFITKLEQTTEFTPVVSDQCVWCGYFNTCPNGGGNGETEKR